MEPVFHLYRQHARIGPVRATEGVAVVQLVAIVRDVSADQADRKALAESFSQRQIEGVITRQVIGPVTVQESRAIIKRQGGEAAPWQVALHTDGKSVALLVVQIKTSIGRRRKMRYPASHASEPLGLLVRVHQVRVIVT